MTEPHRASPAPLVEAAAPAVTPATLVPDSLVNIAALGWRVLAIAAVVVVLWLLGSLLWTVTASVAVAIVVAAFFAPYALSLRRRGRSPAAAAGIVWVVALAIVVGVLVLLAVALVPYLVALVGQLEAGIDAVESALAGLGLPPAVAAALRAALSTLLETAGGGVSGIAASAASAVTVAVLAAFLVFFFLKDGDRAWLWLFQGVADEKRARITVAGEDAVLRVGGYLRGTTVLSAIIAITDYAFMSILGVPLALPLAVLVFLSGYIPYFGGIVTTLLLLLVTYAALGLTPVIVMVVLIAIRNAILGYGVRPIVYGRTVKIHPALVLVALPAGFQLAGIVGLFAAVPVTAIVLAVASATVAIVDPGPGVELPALVPGWLDRIAQWSWRILVAVALIGVIVGVFVVMPLVLVPVLFAAILASTLLPLVSRLVARGQSRARAAAVATGGGFLAVAAIVVLAFVSLLSQAAEVASTASQGAADTDAASGGNLGLVRDAVDVGARQALQVVRAVGGEAAAMLIVIVLSVLLAFYVLRDGAGLWARLVQRVPAEAALDVRDAAGRAVDVLGGYMIGTGAISLVGAASQLVIMLLLGLPLALPVFVLSFFLCFIPYVGGFLSTGIALFITIAVGSPVDVAVMAAWTVVFNIVTGNVVGPLVYGKAVHLHPAVVLIAVPAGAAVAGVLGMFMVVPLLGVVAATWRTVLGVVGMRRRSREVRPPGDASQPDEAMSPVDRGVRGLTLDGLPAPEPA